MRKPFDRILATILAVAPQQPAKRRDAAIDTIIERCHGRPLRELGLAAFDGPARAIRCALTLISETTNHEPKLGVAVHSGECQLTDDGARGIALDIATQLAARTEPGQVLVSQTIRDLVVGSTIQLQSQGRRSFQGVTGEWDVFAVLSADP